MVDVWARKRMEELRKKMETVTLGDLIKKFGDMDPSTPVVMDLDDTRSFTNVSIGISFVDGKKVIVISKQIIAKAQ